MRSQTSTMMKTFCVAALLAGVLTTTGCGLLWFTGGAAVGAAVAKDAEDEKVIDE